MDYKPKLKITLYGALNEKPTGPSRVTNGIAYGLAEVGHEVELVTTGTRNEHNHQNVSVTHVDGNVNSVVNFVQTKRKVSQYIREVSDNDIYHALAGIIDGADVLTCQGIGADLQILKSAPQIIDSTREFVGANIYTLLKMKGIRHSRVTAATSPLVANQMRTFARQKPEQVIPLGVYEHERTKSTSTSKQVRVLFPGRLEPKKGQRKVLEHLQTDEKYQVDIVGKESDKEYSRQLKNRWSDCMHGFVDDDELDDFYQKSDIVVVASEHENFGLTAVEAIARGCLVVITDSCGFATLDDSTPLNGICPVSNPKEAAKEIKYHAENTDVLRSRKKAAYNLSERYTWKNIAEEYTSLYINNVL